MENKGVIAYLLLGSNIGNRSMYLKNAVDSLANFCEIEQVSAIYETESWGDRAQTAYLNQALAIHTDQDPFQLHQMTRSIEKEMGRKDKGKYLPRTIDIDILFFGDELIRSEKLIIPHPRIQIRRFVLTPLAEIAPYHIHPVLGKTVNELLKECEDELQVVRYENKTKQNTKS